MAAVENSAMVSTKEVDYLDEDKPIRGQNFVLLSFLSPEDVIVNKEAYIFTKFIEKFSDDMKKLLEGIKEKNPEQKDMVDTIADNHSYIFEPKEMNEQLAFYKSVNNDTLEANYHKDNNFITSMRGIKVRGTFDTIEEAKVRSEFLKKIDNKFNIYIAQVGCWCPWSPNPESLDNQEYSETQLNTLMKEYKKNMDNRDIVFENRKQTLASNAAPVAAEGAVGDNVEASNENEDGNIVRLDEVKDEIEKTDVWTERNVEK
jgi:hypothetical protein